MAKKVNVIDVSFDFRRDAQGKDPDLHSPTLKNYHKILWTKPLPSGSLFELQDGERGVYLQYQGVNIQMPLGSDTISNSYQETAKMKKIIKEIPQDKIESFGALGSTIGARLLFPSNRINGKMTINGARGFHSRIADRFDLTLECVRRHYLGLENPLNLVLNRYFDFFQLFHTFKGYVDFFFLNDLVNADYSIIKYFTEMADPFFDSPLPRNVSEYEDYRRNTMDFIDKRNNRIAGSASYQAFSKLTKYE
jgi:hypothetical protein